MLKCLHTVTQYLLCPHYVLYKRVDQTTFDLHSKTGRTYKKVKVKVCIAVNGNLTATECHLPYGITQYYLPPDTSEHTPP